MSEGLAKLPRQHALLEKHLEDWVFREPRTVLPDLVWLRRPGTLPDRSRFDLLGIMRDVDFFVGVASVGNDPTWSEQCEQAIAAFRAGGFLLLVDDRQVEDLSEHITIEVGSTVSFVTLVPLVGG